MAKNSERSKKVINRIADERTAKHLKKTAEGIAQDIIDFPERYNLGDLYDALHAMRSILDEIHAFTLKYDSFTQYYTPVRHLIFVIEDLREEKKKLYGTK